MPKTKVGAVRYLNTRPLLYGIRNHPVFGEMDLAEDYPANVARNLTNGTFDVGLVPVAAIPQIPNAKIITDYCIGCDGPVASVCIFSEMPLQQIQTVLLDYQSRTSVQLAKILLAEYWKQDVRYVDTAGEEYLQRIAGTTAGIVIGDRALNQRSRSKFIYDLGEAWKAHTGLPFVFAAWVSNKALPPDFTGRFNEANALGVKSIDTVIRQTSAPHDLVAYYKRNISYQLDERKKEALGLFLDKLKRRP